MRRLPKLANLCAAFFRPRLAYIRAVQFGFFFLGGVAAFLLRFEFSIPRAMLPALWKAVAVWVLVKILVFHLFGLGRGVWRYFSTHDVVRLTKAHVVASSFAAVAILSICPRPFPRAVLVIDFLVSMVVSVTLRAGARRILDLASRTNARNQAFIYGAGAAGALLLTEARLNGTFGHVICVFIDDDPDKHGMLL